MIPPGALTEYPVDEAGKEVAYSQLGADTEAIAKCHSPTRCRFRYVLADEYIPSLLFTDALGVVTQRLVPVRVGCSSL